MIKRIHSISMAVTEQQFTQIFEYYTHIGGFQALERSSGTSHAALEALFDVEALAYTTVGLAVKTAHLELTMFAFPDASSVVAMPVIGPGITHICYQSPATQPAYDRFKGGATHLISRGEHPIDLARAGITYAYARDPAGNIFEMEQLDLPPYPESLWMGHVALVTHDIEHLTTFYSETLLGQPQLPAHFRFANNPRLDDVVDIDGIDLIGAWIREFTPHLEFWQYITPPTPTRLNNHVPRQGYYSINFEVDDVQSEYDRLRRQGVRFAAPPQACAGVVQTYGFDPDGNAFQLRQAST
jgi:catechol 2,3-dioxygenase-like lactoylglutathione lyase family enzyme